VYEGVGQFDHEISDVAKVLVEIPEKRLPLIQLRGDVHIGRMTFSVGCVLKVGLLAWHGRRQALHRKGPCMMRWEGCRGH